MKPIIFNTEMVRTILDGRKTQTRRVIKKVCLSEQYHYREGDKYPYYFRRRDAIWDSFKTMGDLLAKYSPYGVPGDKLWVKETWNAKSIDGTWWEDMVGTCSEKMAFNWNMYFKAESEACEKWRPSRFMPKAFSRITLEIKDVRVERVQDISGDDISAEGMIIDFVRPQGPKSDAHGQFSELWDSINLKRGFGWETNPWVWVVEFEKCQ